MGALVRCWRCDTQFRPTWRDERLCSAECLRELRTAVRRGRACHACGRDLHPRVRADALFCSARCRQRVVRRIAIERHHAFVRELVAEDRRELREAWRRAQKTDPWGYARTRLADRLRIEEDRISALHEKREFRLCEHCEKPLAMRKSQKYCSGRCRVAAHRRVRAHPATL